MVAVPLKSYIVGLILGLFLGLFGVDRFYKGAIA
ncbi:NINE protein [Helicobacter equorum]